MKEPALKYIEQGERAAVEAIATLRKTVMDTEDAREASRLIHRAARSSVRKKIDRIEKHPSGFPIWHEHRMFLATGGGRAIRRCEAAGRTLY